MITIELIILIIIIAIPIGLAIDVFFDPLLFKRLVILPNNDIKEYNNDQKPDQQHDLHIIYNHDHKVIATIMYPKPNIKTITTSTNDLKIETRPITHLIQTSKMNEKLFASIFKNYLQAVINSYSNHDQWPITIEIKKSKWFDPHTGLRDLTAIIHFNNQSTTIKKEDK